MDVSITKSITVHCDVCSQWNDAFAVTVTEARRLARQRGWLSTAHGDLCPVCCADARAEVG